MTPTTLRPADDAFAARLRAELPEAAFRPLTAAHLQEPRGRWHGLAGVLVAPDSTAQVAAAVRLAAAARVPVLPYGGGTGLVGGQIMPQGPAPMLLSLERMRRVRGLWPEENVIEVEAGAILEEVHAAAAAAGRLFPLSIAAKGSARIGGLLATNAGGVNVLRYGNARDLCLGLEAVLPDGSVLHGLKRLRKDNMGYDLRHLLIGSEGTLGVITAATLRLFAPPAAEGTALLAVPDPGAALALLALAQAHLGEAVSAFELMHRTGLDFLTETMPGIRLPLAPPPRWSVLIEIGLAPGRDPAEALAALFEEAHMRGLVADGVIARSEAQRAGLWALRERIPEANRRIGAISSHDISLPLGAIAAFVDRAGASIAALGPLRVNCFGHLGDGNLHYNVFAPAGESRAAWADRREAITRRVHDLVHEMGGSISAEHGIGRLKVADLERYGDPAHLAAMRAIKQALDPAGIMNPGAVLRAAAGAGA
ncbi:MAG: FAD-binding oxidoreductase [Roseovarius sp.]